MFCSKCGASLPDNFKVLSYMRYFYRCSINGKNSSLFPTNNIDFSLIGEFIKSIFINPLSTSKEFATKLLTTVSISYFAIMALIFSLVCTLSVNSLLKSIIMECTKLSYTLNGNSLLNSDLLVVNTGINQTLQQFLPFKSILIWTFTSIIIFYLAIMLLVYLFHSTIYKSQINISSYFVIFLSCINTSISCSICCCNSIYYKLLFNIHYINSINYFNSNSPI